MLQIKVDTTESFDEETEEFVEVGGFILEFEHSLVSVSKWESIFEKPFLGKDPKTTEETIEYIKAMLVTEDPPEDYINLLTRNDFDKISDYINASRTATTFSDTKKSGPSREVVTSELIYYWMVAAQIPFECENWHLERLFALIRICSIKNDSNPKKMSKSEIAARNRELNAQRRQKLGTTG